jgi:hypothetical protein
VLLKDTLDGQSTSVAGVAETAPFFASLKAAF